MTSDPTTDRHREERAEEIAANVAQERHLSGDTDDLMQLLAIEEDPRFADIAGRAYIRIRTLQAALASPSASLDEAWKEAEAALPEGWGIEIVPNEYRAPARNGRWFAMVVRDIQSFGSAARVGYGDTPAAALRSLASALTRETTDDR